MNQLTNFCFIFLSIANCCVLSFYIYTNALLRELSTDQFSALDSSSPAEEIYPVECHRRMQQITAYSNELLHSIHSSTHTYIIHITQHIRMCLYDT